MCGWAGCWRGLGGAAAGAGGGGATTVSRGGCVSPGAIARRFTFSTTTAFERPCEKLWRTMPASTGRFKVSFLAGATLSVVSPGFLVSFISISIPGPRPFGFIAPNVRRASQFHFIRFHPVSFDCSPDGDRVWAFPVMVFPVLPCPVWTCPVRTCQCRRSGPVKRQLPAASQKTLSRRSFDQSCMYHICPSQSQIQLVGRKQFYARCCLVTAIAPAQVLPEFAHSVSTTIRRMNEASNGPRGNSLFHFGKAGDDEPRFVGHRQSLETILCQQSFDLGRQTFRRYGLCLKTTGKSLPFDSFRNAISPRRYPNAASRQFSSDVGHHDRTRSHDEANHVLRQTFRPGDDAGSLGGPFRVEESGSCQMRFSLTMTVSSGRAHDLYHFVLSNGFIQKR